MAAWATTVDALVRNFLSALNASVPSMRAARILDDDLTGLDDWERLCDTLYRLLVIEPIRASLPKPAQAVFDLPSYETQYESLEDFSLIQVTPPGKAAPPRQIAGTAVFFRFLPGNEQTGRFDLVETVRVNEGLTIEETSWETARAEEVYFTCLVPERQGWRLLDHVQVEME